MECTVVCVLSDGIVKYKVDHPLLRSLGLRVVPFSEDYMHQLLSEFEDYLQFKPSIKQAMTNYKLLKFCKALNSEEDDSYINFIIFEHAWETVEAELASSYIMNEIAHQDGACIGSCAKGFELLTDVIEQH